MIVLGLGNPGEEYGRTRHNAGFLVVEAARERWKGGRWRQGAAAAVAQVRVSGVVHRLVRPTTFMNRSGEVVRELLRSGAAPGDLLVVLDDIDLPLGRLRLRAEGGAGGHRGLQSVLAVLAPASVARLRIGVGRPDGGTDAADHVLAEFSAEEWPRMEAMIVRSLAVLEVVLCESLAAAMDRFNGLAAPWEENNRAQGGNGQAG